MKTFKPAKGLKNKHLQSILSSTGPRKILEKRRARMLLKCSKQHVIATPQGVKLLGYLSKTKQLTKGLAIILHGWEGSADSLYVLSSGQKLLDDGFDVFRLNFRDHGDTQHLNKDLFNSTRLQEVVEAIKYLCDKFGGPHNVLCGYSLGGNFCLRVANLAKSNNLNLHQAIAICPLLDPPTTMDQLNKGLPVYEKYFVKKWKKSLFKKLKHHSHFDYGNTLKKLTTLDQMNEFFVIDYTPYSTTNAYFEAYSVLGDRLDKLAIPTTVITSLDDPIIPANQLSQLFKSPWLNIELQQHGGHCAFIKN
ncbi:MAG: alpha/beta fold hydrolase, partial [Psychromonas sp.]